MSQSTPRSYYSYHHAYASPKAQYAQQQNMAVTSIRMDPFYELRQESFELPPVQSTDTRFNVPVQQIQQHSSRPPRSIAIADLLSPDEGDKVVASSSRQTVGHEVGFSAEQYREDTGSNGCQRMPCTCNLTFRPRSQESVHHTQSRTPSAASQYSAVSSGHQASPSQVEGASQHSAVSSPVSWISSLDAPPEMLPNTTTADAMQPSRNYSLDFRQQPQAARACGHGDRDRRVVDPPPIIQLKITNSADGTPMHDPGAVFAMYSYLVDADTGNEMTHPAHDQLTSSNTGAMMGTLVVNPFQGKDEYGSAGTFFIFSDISCRFPGRYKLKFELLRINLQTPAPGTVHGMVAVICSETFTTYPAKDFPGMQASSALLRAFKRQGLNVGIKKGSEARKLLKGKGRKRSVSQESDRLVTPRGPAPGTSEQEYHAALMRKTEMGRSMKRARQMRIQLP